MGRWFRFLRFINGFFYQLVKGPIQNLGNLREGSECS